MAGQKIEDRFRKGVVGVSHHHMRGICDVGIFGVRDQVAQMRHRLFGNQIARSAANEMHW